MVRHYSMALIFMLVIVTALVPAGFVLASSDAPAAHGEHVAASAHGDAPAAAAPAAPASTTHWWIWPLSLFVVTFILGILAVLGGVGGGVLFVPIVGGFFPFNIDFVRGAGLLVALAGALAAGPGLLKRNLASLRLALPVAIIASSAAIVGAMIGLALKPDVVNTLLGGTILFIVAIMITAKKSDFPNVPKPDALSQSLNIMGIYREDPSARTWSGTSTRRPAAWRCSSSSASWPACSAWARDGRTCRC